MTRGVHSTLVVLLAGSLFMGCPGNDTEPGGSTAGLTGGDSTPVARVEQASPGQATGAVPLTALPSAPFQDCQWRKCEVEGPLKCEGSDQICDMYRNQCVPACQDNDCCAGVSCPEGSVCATGLGRCGLPVGQGCFDMGTTWWTGRDIPPDQRQVSEDPTPVAIVVHNDGDEPLYFESTLQQPVRFDLHLQYCGRMQKLELAENHFCPTLCPDQGPALEVDCGKPPPIVQRLPAGETVSVGWSGAEQVGMRRICDKPAGQFCLVSRVTLSGTYTLEVCAHTDVDGGQPDANDPNRLIRARPAGERQCRQVAFQHPTTAPVEIRFGV